MSTCRQVSARRPEPQEEGLRELRPVHRRSPDQDLQPSLATNRLSDTQPSLASNRFSGHAQEVQFQSRRSRSSVSSSLEQAVYTPAIQEPPRSALRKTTARRHPRFSVLHGHDGTNVRICTDRLQRRRETQAPGLGLSLFDMRNNAFWTDEKECKRGILRQQGQEATQRQQLLQERDDSRCSNSVSPRLRARAQTQDVRYEMLQMAGDSSGRVQVERLCDHGFTTEDLSRVIYDKFRDQDLPDFLDYIGLERKGGLDRIMEIWSPEKYFWFFFLIGSVLFNMANLLAMDWMIFTTFTKEVVTEVRSFDLRNVTQAVGSLAEMSAQTNDIAKHVKDPEIRWWLLNVAAVVATWEVCWVCVKVLHTVYIWWLFCYGGSEYKSFHAVMYFFQKLLPQCSTFSAIKLMARVHPSLIYNEYLYFVFESSWRSTWAGLTLVSAYFFLRCTACAMAALGAFTIKVLAVGMKVMNPQYGVLYRVGSIAALMNQCMGCVIMEVVLQDRLFLFVFGGQEAMYQDRGIAYKNVYECRMAKQIWDEFWEKGRRLEAIVLFATFDHYDLQKLLLESTPDDYNNMDLGLGIDSPTESLIPINEAALDTERDSLELEDDDYDIIGPRRRTLLPRKTLAPEPSEALTPEALDLPEVHDEPVAGAGAATADAEGRELEVHFSPSINSLPHQPEKAAREREEGAGPPRASSFAMAQNRQRPPDGNNSRADSFASSTASHGMRAVTSTLQNELGWRDAL